MRLLFIIVKFEHLHSHCCCSYPYPCYSSFKGVISIIDYDLDSSSYSLNPSSSSNNANVIDIFDDSGEENVSVQPKVELPNSPQRNNSSRTFELINKIHTH